MAVFTDELVKLRRRIGDIFAEDGTALTTANVLSVNGAQYTYQELIDAYNDAINEYLGYLTTTKSKDQWSEHAPGYIVYVTNQSVSSSKLNLNGMTLVPFKVISVAKYNVTTPDGIITEIDPSLFFQYKYSLVTQATKDRTYCIMHDGTNWSMFFLPSDPVAVDIIYLKRHVDLTTATTTGFDNQFSQYALKQILLFAEIAMKRGKTLDIVKDAPEAQLATTAQLDLREDK